MKQGQDPSARDTEHALGADVGATLVKLAVRRGEQPLEYRLRSGDAIERVAREVEATGVDRIGVTGGGAAELAELLEGSAARVARVDEFEAWRAGAAVLLEESGQPSGGRYLLVSVGTGCSAVLVEDGRVRRVGGTALGGGTILGLGRALLGSSDFAKLAELARVGDRSRVDLLVSDIYRAGDAPLPGELNAASFAKLAAQGPGEAPQPADLARALMGLVGENVALICAGLAREAGVERIVFGGSTLRGNQLLTEVLQLVCLGMGCRPVFLEAGEFAGARGALEASAGSRPR